MVGVVIGSVAILLLERWSHIGTLLLSIRLEAEGCHEWLFVLQ